MKERVKKRVEKGRCDESMNERKKNSREFKTRRWKRNTKKGIKEN